MGEIARYLNQLIVGNVFDSPEVLETYSTDRSVLKIKPRAVAFPESTDDICRLMRFCYQLAAKDIKIPVTAYGSGLDEMGADLSRGLVISTEKLNKLLEADRRERLVRVQAGITLKELNTALSMNGLTVPISGHDFETIGGLISNCPADDSAGKYGGIMNYVERIEIVLPNGECLQTDRFNARWIKRKTSEKTLEGDIYRKIKKVLEANETLLNEIKKTPRSLSGYSNVIYIKRRNTMDLMPLVFGAEGTLGIISEVILRAIPIKKPASRVVASFDSFKAASKFLDFASKLNPREINLYDANIIKTAEETGKKFNAITKKLEDGYVVTAKFDKRNCAKKILNLKKMLPRNTQIIVDDTNSKISFEELENALTSYLYCPKNGERVPLLTDFYVPKENLAGLAEDLEILREKLGLDLALYGSYTSANYNLRPIFDPTEEDFNKKAMAFLRAGAYIIKRQGGSLAGGSPEGRVKALVTNSEMPAGRKDFYLEIKAIFDRYDIVNPDAKLGADSRYTLNHFRTTGSPKIMI
ncbi:FAD-binding oxidoreductase [Candidatus Saccharibacteria bacterium]|nr:FAD-binding oxidoreductase [Candidatus Saccharibacteria bacterium]